MKELERDIHTIDAEGKTPGRLATYIAKVLIGKHKPTYTPNLDAGDHVQVINASKMKLTGKKVEQKVYHHHTTFASGLRTVSLKTLMSSRPSEVLVRAVSRMLPKNKLRNERMKRLLIKN
ncbi:MAG: 50S ribosomal protein L13 [Patescibacteria group bacterium]